MTQIQKLDLLLATYIAAIVSTELLGSKIFQLGTKNLWLRNNLSNFIGQLFILPEVLTLYRNAVYLSWRFLVEKIILL